MPTYSYRCSECKTAFDIQQSFTDESLTVCPTCGARLRKVFSAIGVSFTGSGFYQNDSRAAAPKAASAAAAPAAPATAAASTSAASAPAASSSSASSTSSSSSS